MSSPTEFALALSSSHPSGTGSFTYEGSFNIVVQNLAFEKHVSIFAQQVSTWKDINATYVKNLPENRELWTAPATDSENDFVAKYVVNGTTYFDNNNGNNYKFPQVFDAFAMLAGSNYKVVLGDAIIGAGSLSAHIVVKNLAFTKEVGIVYTTDNWVTVNTAFAHFTETMIGGDEVWELTTSAGAATEVKFAIFYHVSGTEFWDNNFGRDYRAASGIVTKWGDTP